MRKLSLVVTTVVMLSVFSCEKIDTLIAPKYCWECQQISTAGVGDEQTLRTVSETSHCDLTVTQMQDLENKAKTYQNNNGSWSRISMLCNRK